MTQIEAYNKAQIISHDENCTMCIIKKSATEFDFCKESELTKSQREKVIQTFSITRREETPKAKKKKGK